MVRLLFVILVVGILAKKIQQFFSRRRRRLAPPVQTMPTPKREALEVRIPEDSESAFILCTFSMFGKLANVDGSSDSNERGRVEEYATSVLRLSPEATARALRVYEEARTSPLSLQDYADKFATVFKDRVTLLDKTVTALLELAVADGVFDEKEEREIYSAALRLGISKPHFERLKREHVPSGNFLH